MTNESPPISPIYWGIDKENFLIFVNENKIIRKFDTREVIKRRVEEAMKSKDEEIERLKKQIVDQEEKTGRELEKAKKHNIKFKEHLIQIHLSGRENLQNRDIDFLYELYEETQNFHKLKKGIEKKSKFPEQEELNQESNCPYCSNSKALEALQCRDCKIKINQIRVRIGCGMQEARQIYEKDIGHESIDMQDV